MSNQGLGAFGIFIGATTARPLTFRRASLVKNSAGEFVPDWVTTPQTLTLVCGVQPVGGNRMLNLNFQFGYASAWNILANGAPDIQPQDRVTIDGVEAIVESANQRATHLELLVAARQAKPS